MPDLWMDVDTALSEVPVNLLPLLDDTDFKTRETALAYNAAGLDLVWNFVTTAGAMTQTAVTPTTGGAYDWAHQGDGMYSIEIPASGGASINNDTEGFGWFTGVATGVLPWRGPVIGFRAAAINDGLIDGGDYLDVNAAQVAAATPETGADIAAAVGARTLADRVAAPSRAAMTYDDLLQWLATLTCMVVKHNRTTGELEAYAADGTTKIAEAPVSDSGGASGTLTRGTWGAVD